LYTLNVNIDNLERAFNDFVKEKENKVMKDVKVIAELIRDDIRENIMSSRKVPSGNIKKNTRATIKIKGSSTPLINTGQLYRSVSVRPITNGYEVYLGGDKNNEVAYYNSYDRTQDVIFGKKREKSITIPARPFFGIRSKTKSDLKKILNG
jgi:phage gpG-like protein